MRHLQSGTICGQVDVRVKGSERDEGKEDGRKGLGDVGDVGGRTVRHPERDGWMGRVIVV